MSATDELRALLDERGVEWSAPTSFDGTARYDTTTSDYWFHEFNGKMTIHGLTPEQAIAATLGPKTCHEVKIDRHYRGCSECGYRWEYMYAVGWQIGPNFCPNCGAKVVDE